MTKTNNYNEIKIHIITLVLLFSLDSINAQEISDTSFGKGLINFVAKDSSFSIKFAPTFSSTINIFMGS